MALVHDEQPVRREVVEQRPRPRPRLARGEVAGVVLDAGAVADLAHHLQVEHRALAQSRALQVAALGLELPYPDLHLLVDRLDGEHQLVLRRHVVRGRVDVELLALGEQLPGERVHLGDALHFVAEELDADQAILGGGDELQGVAPNAEAGTRQRGVVALVLEIHEVAQHGVAAVLPADAQPQDRGAVVDRGAQAVDAAHAGDDDHVAPLEQRLGGRVAQLVDLVVPAGVLLDVRVRARQVRLGLVVVEVADEVLDGVVREELAELGVQLGGQGLVVGEHQRGLLVLLDDLRRW